MTRKIVMKISEFIKATNTAKTSEDIFCLYEKALASYGYDRIMYSVLLPHNIYDASQSPCIMRNYPDGWIRHYVEHNYAQVDPVRKYCSMTRFPFSWEDMMSRLDMASDQEKIMLEGRAAGLNDGIAIPLHGPYGELFGVGMASSSGDDHPKDNLSIINLITIQFHNTFMSLKHKDNPVTPPIHLTPREREILLWCTKGKSNWAIGKILNISEHGVDFHMRNIFSKLITDSRITAVVKAIRLGLIKP